MNTSDTFPLITLQPVADSKNAWIALLLEGEIPFDSDALARILGEHTLAEIVESIDCVASVDPAGMDPALAGALSPTLLQHLMLRFPASASADPAHHDRLTALQKAGFRLVASGFTETCIYAQAATRPQPAKGGPMARALLLKMLSLVTTDADTADIEALIKRDTNLSYHLLKLVNSVAISPGKKITNFAQAIAMIGRRQLQRWLQLLLYARSQGSMLASPLMPRAALRASLMENLAKRKGLSRDQQDHAFMTGMFSLLDLLFGSPLAGIIAPLNLSEDVVLALTTGNGPFSSLLAAVKANEGRPSPALTDALAAAGIAHADWASALAEAMQWAVQISKEA